MDVFNGLRTGLDTISSFLSLHAPSLESLHINLSHAGLNEQDFDDIELPRDCDLTRLRSLELSTTLPLKFVIWDIWAENLESLDIEVSGLTRRNIILLAEQTSDTLRPLSISSHASKIDSDMESVPPLRLPGSDNLTIWSPQADVIFGLIIESAPLLNPVPVKKGRWNRL